ncbi:MAG: hypothetical protein ABH876_00955 [Patescibacteria group bacterium]|nr:hypothetical protein [Patescibacteria group bacterium]MBU1876927.1 hypothetical protein [Patescibacteria group bacterium]
MLDKYTKEQFWKLYEKISQELKETIFSEETANNILDICLRNGVEDERVSEVARYTGRVLMGILEPTDFQETLEKELKMEKNTAKKISQGINRFIFYPVKPALEELYKTEIMPIAKPNGSAPLPIEKADTSSLKDVYREAIE